MKRKKAFTLVELLVVIAVIALLLSILIPALRKARDQAQRAHCSNNIHQQLVGFMMYANEHDGKVFGDVGWLDGNARWYFRDLMKAMGINTEGGIHTWNDVSTLPADAPDMVAPDVFYCPSNMAVTRARQEHWDYHHPDGSRATFRIIGFLYILENPPGMQKKPEVMDSRGQEKKWISRLDVKNASEAELVTDKIYSDTTFPEDEYPNGNFAKIIAGSGGGVYTGICDASSHLKNEREVHGSNIGFCDSHVEWRPFTQLEIRFVWPNHWW